MTIGVCLLVPEGIVFASDTRQIVIMPNGVIRIGSDDVEKICPITNNTGIIVMGQSYYYLDKSKSPIDIKSLVRIIFKGDNRFNSVADAAYLLHAKMEEYLDTHCRVTGEKDAQTTIYLAGYSQALDGPGELYRCDVPGKITLERKTTDAGLVWHSESEIVNRILFGVDLRFLDLIEGQENAIQLTP